MPAFGRKFEARNPKSETIRQGMFEKTKPISLGANDCICLINKELRQI